MQTISTSTGIQTSCITYRLQTAISKIHNVESCVPISGMLAEHPLKRESLAERLWPCSKILSVELCQHYLYSTPDRQIMLQIVPV